MDAHIDSKHFIYLTITNTTHPTRVLLKEKTNMPKNEE